LLNKIGFVIRFLSGFCLITGLIVLIASVLISKYQRVQESVLLRTLGATRRQIYQINAVEYAFIGLLATGSGAILAVLAGWAMASFSFDIPFRPDLLPIIGIILTITVLTILIGLFNIRFIVSRSPLEVWRQE
jgi:putative ABC transport system permease protein